LRHARLQLPKKDIAEALLIFDEQTEVASAVPKGDRQDKSALKLFEKLGAATSH
jgi:hypothetical protein